MAAMIIIFLGMGWLVLRPRQVPEETEDAGVQPSFQPRGDRVLVRRMARPEPQAGDVAIPGSQERPLNEGVVVYVGPGKRNSMTGRIDPIVGLEPGAHVCFLDHSGYDVVVDGESLLCMRDEEIFAERG